MKTQPRQYLEDAAKRARDHSRERNKEDCTDRILRAEQKIEAAKRELSSWESSAEQESVRVNRLIDLYIAGAQTWEEATGEHLEPTYLGPHKIQGHAKGTTDFAFWVSDGGWCFELGVHKKHLTFLATIYKDETDEKVLWKRIIQSLLTARRGNE